MARDIDRIAICQDKSAALVRKTTSRIAAHVDSRHEITMRSILSGTITFPADPNRDVPMKR